MAPGSVEVKAKLAEATPIVPLGADVIVVSGGWVSTAKVAMAGVGSVLPTSSSPRTSNVCGPSASGA